MYICTNVLGLVEVQRGKLVMHEFVQREAVEPKSVLDSIEVRLVLRQLRPTTSTNDAIGYARLVWIANVASEETRSR